MVRLVGLGRCNACYGKPQQSAKDSNGLARRSPRAEPVAPLVECGFNTNTQTHEKATNQLLFAYTWRLRGTLN